MRRRQPRTPGRPAASPAAPPEIAGYRIVRILGRGRHAVVHLGHARHPDADGDDAHREDGAGSADGRPEAVAVKIFPPGADRASIARELDALRRAGGDHVATVTDLATTPEGGCALVMPRLAGPSLAAVLAEQPRLRPGEAVTILVSMLRALERLWRAGLRHAAPGPAAFLLDGARRPVMIGLGAVVRVGRDEDAGDADEGAADAAARLRSDVAALIDAVAEHAGARGGDDRFAGIRRGWDADLARCDADPDAVADALVAAQGRLFAVARPLPIPIDRESEEDAGARLPVRAADHGPEGARGGRGRRRAARTARRGHDGERGGHGCEGSGDQGSGGAGSDIAVRMLEAVRSIGVAVAWLRTWVPERIRASRHRRPVLVGAAVGAILLAVALTLLPLGSGSTARSGSPAGAVRPSSAAARPSAARGPGAPTAADTTRATDARRDTEAEHAGDPAAAAGALLAMRARCLSSSASHSCLAAVDEPGSPQASADRGARAHDDDAAADADIGTWKPQLVQRTGDTALVAVAPPAGDHDAHPFSVLLIHTETGWAIRELFE